MKQLLAILLFAVLLGAGCSSVEVVEDAAEVPVADNVLLEGFEEPEDGFFEDGTPTPETLEAMLDASGSEPEGQIEETPVPDPEPEVVETDPGPEQAPEPTPEPGPTGMTMMDVAEHASGASCWSVINGNVYDLTSWVSQHPGGSSRILAICGTDGSSAFNGQHGGQGAPTSTLSGFLLGPLQ